MNDILLQANESFRKDVYEDTILFSLLYWLEMKEGELLSSSLNSARRYFQQQKKLTSLSYEFELHIIDLLKKIKDVNEQKYLDELYTKVESAILITSHEEGKNNYVEHLFTHLFWARGKRRNTDFFYEAESWYKQHIKAKKK